MFYFTDTKYSKQCSLLQLVNYYPQWLPGINKEGSPAIPFHFNKGFLFALPGIKI